MPPFFTFFRHLLLLLFLNLRYGADPDLGRSRLVFMLIETNFIFMLNGTNFVHRQPIKLENCSCMGDHRQKHSPVNFESQFIFLMDIEKYWSVCDVQSIILVFENKNNYFSKKKIKLFIFFNLKKNLKSIFRQ